MHISTRFSTVKCIPTEYFQTVIRSRSQSCPLRATLPHAWLNLLDKHITTGRINQIVRKIQIELYLALTQNFALKKSKKAYLS